MRSEPLEALVISARVRGLSDRDVEALPAEALGPKRPFQVDRQPDLCSPAPRVRGLPLPDLSDIELDHLFLDGSRYKMHDGSRAEPMLVAYGITTAVPADSAVAKC